MFIERRLVPNSSEVELWECEWENRDGMQARKLFLRKIGEEQPIVPTDRVALSRAAICWSYGRTLGNIAVFSPALLGHFPGTSGADATLPCDFVHAGKYRNGVERWWCRTHQTHWGRKADQQSYDRSRVMVCANHEQTMHYVVRPLEVDVDKYAELAIHCVLPAAQSSQSVSPSPPRIHVRATGKSGGAKSIDGWFDAISLIHAAGAELFGSKEISRVNVTPPAAFDFVCALEFGRDLSCVSCSHCGYPHLDLGDFAKKPHRKHFCANCGRDSTWSKKPIVSSPLKPIHDLVAKNDTMLEADGRIDLSSYAGADYWIRPSMPAVLWTGGRPQRKGLHVLVVHGAKTIVDDTFGEVVVDGRRLERTELLAETIQRTII